MSTIKFSDEMTKEAKRAATVQSRSIPKQIEHWARIGKMVEENPNLPYGFIVEILLAVEEEGQSQYEFGPNI